MTQAQSPLTGQELEHFSQKLAQFRERLNPQEQRLFMQLMEQARSATSEVQGYDDGRPGDAPTQLEPPQLNWPTILGNPGSPPVGPRSVFLEP